ncbi:MAG: AI-2E family transporter [bacterium]
MAKLQEQKFNVTITTGTIFKVVAIFILFYMLYLIRDIALVLFIALILSSAFDPWVDWMQRHKIPRGIGILAIYTVVISIIAFSVYLLVPPISKEISSFISNFPLYLEKITQSYSAVRTYTETHGLLPQLQTAFGSASSNIQAAATNVFSGVYNFVGGIFTLILIAVIIFYMTVEEEAIKKLVWTVAPAKKRYYVMSLINRMQKKINSWLKAQLILSLAIFCLTYVGLWFLPIEYKLVLALIAGITETVPYIGPMIGAIPAIFLALTVSPGLALAVAILYYVIQQVENNLLVPKVMQKTVGLNPIVSIAVLLIGFNLGGIIGAMLSMPVATALSVFVGDVLDGRSMDVECLED